MNDVLKTPVKGKQVLSAFDFDGTLTYHDTFVPFLRFAFGNRLFAMRLLRMIPATACYLLGRISRNALKEKLIAVYLTGAKESWVKERAEAFCDVSWQRLMRPLGLTSVANQIEQGAKVTICSASPQLQAFLLFSTFRSRPQIIRSNDGPYRFRPRHSHLAGR